MFVWLLLSWLPGFFPQIAEKIRSFVLLFSFSLHLRGFLGITMLFVLVVDVGLRPHITLIESVCVELPNRLRGVLGVFFYYFLKFSISVT